MVDIICIFTATFYLRDNNEQLVERDEKPLQPGNYFIISNGKPPRSPHWLSKNMISHFRRQETVASLAKLWVLVSKRNLPRVAAATFTICDIILSAALSYHGLYSLQTGSITLTEEDPLLRALSLQSGTPIVSFRDAVYERDR